MGHEIGRCRRRDSPVYVNGMSCKKVVMETRNMACSTLYTVANTSLGNLT